jgi:predicted  nucleic acid-binding Zn-ribbon protein
MSKKKATSEITVEERLRALYDLQLIDSRIDRIRTIRGELPLEVQDLEDEIAGLETRLGKVNDELKELEGQIKEKTQLIKDSKALQKKYQEQQNKVRNNREFDSINKEIEYQELEEKLAKKHIKEFEIQVESKKLVIEEIKKEFEDRKGALEIKKSELDEIIDETRKEEDILVKKSAELSEMVEDRYLIAYRRIRGSAKNGLAVVPVDRERGASGGSFLQIPPQKQLDIAARKKVIIDEHSGRILVDAELAIEEAEKIDKLVKSLIG